MNMGSTVMVEVAVEENGISPTSDPKERAPIILKIPTPPANAMATPTGIRKANSRSIHAIMTPAVASRARISPKVNHSTNRVETTKITGPATPDMTHFGLPEGVVVRCWVTVLGVLMVASLQNFLTRTSCGDVAHRADSHHDGKG